MHAFDPDISCSSDGKNEKEDDENKGLQIISCDPFHSIENGTKQLSLHGEREREKNISTQYLTRSQLSPR